MTVIDRLQQQVDIRGTASPFGALAADALAEIEQLRDALKKANEQAEHFEREWYLRGDALEQLLDDMGENGHCVCEAAKQMANDALLPNC